MSCSIKFKQKNYKKYKGDPTKIFYRSLWERRFMVYCDNNIKIVEWGSEELIIVQSPLDKVHRYFPDFYVKYLNKKGNVVREIIEVKPKKQLRPPRLRRDKPKISTRMCNLMVNQQNGKAESIVLTEK